MENKEDSEYESFRHVNSGRGYARGTLLGTTIGEISEAMKPLKNQSKTLIPAVSGFSTLADGGAPNNGGCGMDRMTCEEIARIAHETASWKKEVVEKLWDATDFWQERLAVLKFEAGRDMAALDTQILRHLARKAKLPPYWG